MNFPISSAQTIEQHRKNLNDIVNQHLNEAQNRVIPVYLKYFASPGVVMDRHWRNRSDIPKELATLPRSVWGKVKSLIPYRSQPDKKVDCIPLSNKQIELYKAIEIDLLDMDGLDKKLRDYVQQYQSSFDTQLNELLSDLPINQRETVEKQLIQHIERMALPVEGSRETLMCLLTGVIGKGLGASGFGSSIATGQAAATAIYTSNLSWWGSLWVGLTGVPGWVSLVGATGGIMAMLVVAPFFAPLLEVGMNRFRGKKMLFEIIEHIRNQVTKPPSDKVDILGQLAIYLQLLPDIIQIAAKLKA